MKAIVQNRVLFSVGAAGLFMLTWGRGGLLFHDNNDNDLDMREL